MNILILNWRDVRHPKSGGAELVTMEHAKRWAKKGHRVTWLTASYPGALSENKVDGVHFVRRWGSLSVYLYAPIYLLLNSRLVDVVVDEVHGFPFFSPLFSRKPVVVFIHEIAGEIWDYMFPFPKNIMGKLLEKWYFLLYKHCLFWTDAESTVDELVERGIRRNQCFPIPCPLIQEKKVSTLRISKQSAPTYLFVSRVVRMKGIEEVVKAFAFIHKTQTNAQLWIVGAGEEKYVEELQKMIAEYGVDTSVKFWGGVTEEKKFDLMARSHVLLHASVKEGWGLVVLEAASVGTPAVVYNVAGLRDVVKHNETGIVLSHNSPIEMAKEAMKLIKDEKRYRKYQSAGKKWVGSLQWSHVSSQSLALLEKAVMI
jgi:glycosyltransferase involved in cell wall biosynthesis